MRRFIKSTMMVTAGLCWIALAVFICLFLYGYLVGGAGLQLFGVFFPFSSTTVLVGLVHFVGFSAAAFLSFAIGVCLCAHGVVPGPELEQKTVAPRRSHFAFFRRRIVSAPPSQVSAKTLCCVRCRVALATPVHLCPNCGWTQPGYHDA
jgi:hypothetical protein